MTKKTKSESKKDRRKQKKLYVYKLYGERALEGSDQGVSRYMSQYFVA